MGLEVHEDDVKSATVVEWSSMCEIEAYIDLMV